MTKTVPTFLGIGPEKSGSTSLFQYMKQHPELYLSPLKNLKYFTSDWEQFPSLHSFSYSFEDYGKGVSYKSRMVTSEVEYLKFFEAAKSYKAIGEVTPSYISVPVAPKKIHKFNPDIKIIAVLRNPIDRAYSQFNFHSQKGLESGLDFEKILEQEQVDIPIVIDEKFRNGERPKTYIRQGLYYKNLKRYYDLFPSENIKIYLYEELKNAPEALLKDVFSFLGVNPDFKVNLKKRFNETRIPKNQKNLDVKIPVKYLKVIPRPIKDLGKNIIDQVKRRNSVKPKELTLEERKTVLHYFEEDIKNLEKLLDKDLSHWYKF